jgi:hypothetical protein
MVPLVPDVDRATNLYVESASMPWVNSGIQSTLCVNIAKSRLLEVPFMNMEVNPTARFITTNKLAACAPGVARLSQAVALMH